MYCICLSVYIFVIGFRKENLRVQLNNARFVVVKGERVVDQARGQKFVKEVRVPEDCVRNEIKAKLTGGVLYLTMPKKPPLVIQQQRLDENESETTTGGGGGGWSMRRIKRPQMEGKFALKLGALAAVVVFVSVGSYLVHKYHQSLNAQN